MCGCAHSFAYFVAFQLHEPSVEALDQLDFPDHCYKVPCRNCKWSKKFSVFIYDSDPVILPFLEH